MSNKINNNNNMKNIIIILCIEIIRFCRRIIIIINGHIAKSCILHIPFLLYRLSALHICNSRKPITGPFSPFNPVNKTQFSLSKNFQEYSCAFILQADNDCICKLISFLLYWAKVINEALAMKCEMDYFFKNGIKKRQ